MRPVLLPADLPLLPVCVQVWEVMRAAVASGVQDYVMQVACLMPYECPKALLVCPWKDTMIELAVRFPECAFMECVGGGQGIPVYACREYVGVGRCMHTGNM